MRDFRTSRREKKWLSHVWGEMKVSDSPPLELVTKSLNAKSHKTSNAV